MAKLKFSNAPSDLKKYEQFRGWLMDNMHFHFCSYCIVSHEYLEIDHFEPQKMSPKKINDADNLLLACGKCNGKAGKSDYHPKNKYRIKEKNKRFNVINVRKDNFEKLFELNQLTGELKPLVGSNYEKAINNILLLNLDRPFLRKMRREYCEMLNTVKQLMAVRKEVAATKSYLKKLLVGIEEYELFFFVFGIKFNRNLKRNFNINRKRAKSIK